MKAFLMFENNDFDSQCKIPQNRSILADDLELKTLFDAMSSGNEFIFNVVEKSVLSGLYNDVETMVYRQDILKDCIVNPSVIKEIYSLAEEALEVQKRHFYGVFMRYPASILVDSLDLLLIFSEMLKKLRNIADTNVDKFISKGFKRFFAMLQAELTDEYFSEVVACLKGLKFRNGVVSGVKLGKYNKGEGYILRKPDESKFSWWQLLLHKRSDDYTFHIFPGDENGASALSELKDRGINQVANSLAQSADHIISFFRMLVTDLAFYIGCLNLREKLVQLNMPFSFPLPESPHKKIYTARQMYDICLALSTNQKLVLNDILADEKNLIVMTGANQGGKSTLLRSVGLSQLMMQCGMFVPADFFHASVCDSLFTHYKKEEDTSMTSGKLDEELGRMSDIIDQVTPGSILLFNESFAATNEREGSEIAGQITNALLDKHRRIFFVTHLYEFAHHLFERRKNDAVFLRAERRSDGQRTFKIRVGEPLQTSYGVDLYHKIFDQRR